MIATDIPPILVFSIAYLKSFFDAQIGSAPV